MKSFYRNSVIWLVIVVSIPIVGCSASNPIKMNFDEGATFEDHEIELVVKSCQINLLSVEDGRKRRKDVGNMGRQPIIVDEPDKWLRASLKTFLGTRFKLAENFHATHSNRLGLEVRLLKMYHHILPSTQSAIVVLNAQIHQNGDKGKAKLFRGRSTSVNWTGSESSIRESFDKALGSALHKISHELNYKCRAS